jgi:hypothetical protein
MSKREAILAGIIAVSLGGWALLSWVIDPALAAFDEVAQETKQLEQDLNAAKVMVDSETKILGRWSSYEKAGLSRTLEQADAETGRALFAWAENAGFKQINLSDGKPKTDDELPFAELSYTMQSTGKLSQIVDLLWAIRSSSLPLKVEKCVIDLKNNKSDDLQLSLTVSTLFTPEEASR